MRGGCYKEGGAVDGRTFLHVWDDVRHHIADRRPDLCYLLEARDRWTPRVGCAGLRTLPARAAQNGLESGWCKAAMMDD